MDASRQAAFLLFLLVVLALPAPVSAAPRATLCTENRDSVAVIIGNSDYEGSIPDVPFAINDARAIKAFLVDRLCYREGNIILLENATYADFLKVFGDSHSPEGKLWNWARKGRSNIFVYYSGHGAPDIRTGDGFLVPVNGDPDNPRLGMSLNTVMTNLKALKTERIGKDRQVSLFLDACFSGREGTGKALIKGSFSGWRPKRSDPGDEILHFSAAAADEIARWDEDRKHGLFTRVFLDAIDGGADQAPFGNGDGKITGDELTAYLRDEVAYLARRRYGEEQTPETPAGRRIPWRFAATNPKPNNTGPNPAPVSTIARPAKPVVESSACDGVDTVIDGIATCLKPGDTFRDCLDCPEMTVLPAGTFAMGSPDSEPSRSRNEGPRHRVTFQKPFAIGKFEITFSDWDKCVADGACRYRPGAPWGRGRRPVMETSWEDAKEFVGWLNLKISGSTSRPYRLPSEAEWEYAARAGTTTPFWTGEHITSDQANFDGKRTYNGSKVGIYRGKSTEVGFFPANPFGLHDMNGNAWEWVEDCYSDSYRQNSPAGTANVTGDCKSRVLRGGSTSSSPSGLRSAMRSWYLRDYRLMGVGFRLARSFTTTNLLATDGSKRTKPKSNKTIEPASCKVVRFSDVGWTDVTAATAAASVVLRALGYEPESKLHSVSETFQSLKDSDTDVFLGNWMPTMEHELKSYRAENSIEIVRVNLEDGKYTLAVPKYTYDAGLRDFSDIYRFSNRLESKIFGTESGNEGNELIKNMIENNIFGLKNFQLIESSEEGMINNVKKRIKNNMDVVFLGWEPHPMNSMLDIQYLTGGDNFFGPNFGGSKVYTVTRKDYSQECPNIGVFLRNLVFPIKLENEIMGAILYDRTEPETAALMWLKLNPQVMATWTMDVSTYDGGDSVAALKAMQQY